MKTKEEIADLVEVRTEVKKILPHATVEYSQPDRVYVIRGSAGENVFSHIEYVTLKEMGLYPSISKCFGSKEKILLGVRKCLQS